MARIKYCIRCGDQTKNKYYCDTCTDDRDALKESFVRIIKENPEIEPESLAELLAWHAVDEIPVSKTYEAYKQ